MEPLSIVLVQKNNVLRSHLVKFLTMAGMKIVADTDDLSQLEVMASQWEPSVVLLDMEIVRECLPTWVTNLRQVLPKVKVVLTGPEPKYHYAKFAEALGADLYLSVEERPNEWTVKLNDIAKE